MGNKNSSSSNELNLKQNDILQKIISSMICKCYKVTAVDESYIALILIDNKWYSGDGKSEENAILNALQSGLTEIYSLGRAIKLYKATKPISVLIYELPTVFQCTKQIINNMIRIKLMWNDIIISECGPDERTAYSYSFSKLIAMGIKLKKLSEMMEPTVVTNNIQNKNEEQLPSSLMKNDPSISNEDINVQNPTVNVVPQLLTNSKIESLITSNSSETMIGHNGNDNKTKEASTLQTTNVNEETTVKSTIDDGNKEKLISTAGAQSTNSKPDAENISKLPTTTTLANDCDTLLDSKAVNNSNSLIKTTGIALQILPKIVQSINIKYDFKLGINKCLASMELDNIQYLVFDNDKEIATFKIIKDAVNYIISQQPSSITIKNPISKMIYQFIQAVTLNIETITENDSDICRTIIVINDETYYGEDKNLLISKVNVIAKILTSKCTNVLQPATTIPSISTIAKSQTAEASTKLGSINYRKTKCSSDMLTTIHNTVTYQLDVTPSSCNNSNDQCHVILKIDSMLHKGKGHSINIAKCDAITKAITDIVKLFNHSSAERDKYPISFLIYKFKSTFVFEEDYSNNKIQVHVMVNGNKVIGQGATLWHAKLNAVAQTIANGLKLGIIPASSAIAKTSDVIISNKKMENEKSSSILTPIPLPPPPPPTTTSNGYDATNTFSNVPVTIDSRQIFKIKAENLLYMYSEILKSISYDSKKVNDVIKGIPTWNVILKVDAKQYIGIGLNEEVAKIDAMKCVINKIRNLRNISQLKAEPTLQLVFKLYTGIVCNYISLNTIPKSICAVVMINNKLYYGFGATNVIVRVDVFAKILTNFKNPSYDNIIIINGSASESSSSTISKATTATNATSTTNTSTATSSSTSTILGSPSVMLPPPSSSLILTPASKDMSINIPDNYKSKSTSSSTSKNQIDTNNIPMPIDTNKIAKSIIPASSAIAKTSDVIISNKKMENEKSSSILTPIPLPPPPPPPPTTTSNGYDATNTFSNVPVTIDSRQIFKIKAENLLYMYSEILKSISYDSKKVNDVIKGIPTWNVILKVDAKQYIGIGLNEEVAKIDAMKCVINKIRNLRNISQLKAEPTLQLVFKLYTGIVCNYISLNTIPKSICAVVMINNKLYYGFGATNVIVRVDVFAKILTNFKNPSYDNIIIINGSASESSSSTISKATTATNATSTTNASTATSSSTSTILGSPSVMLPPPSSSLILTPASKDMSINIPDNYKSKSISSSTSKNQIDTNNIPMPIDTNKIAKITSKHILQIYSSILKSITYDSKELIETNYGITTNWSVILRLDNAHYPARGVTIEDAKISAMKCAIIDIRRLANYNTNELMKTSMMIYRFLSTLQYNYVYLKTKPANVCSPFMINEKIYYGLGLNIALAKIDAAAKILTNVTGLSNKLIIEKDSSSKPVLSSSSSTSSLKPASTSTPIVAGVNKFRSPSPAIVKTQDFNDAIEKAADNLVLTLNSEPFTYSETTLRVCRILESICCETIKVPIGNNLYAWTAILKMDGNQFMAKGLTEKSAKIEAMKLVINKASCINQSEMSPTIQTLRQYISLSAYNEAYLNTAQIRNCQTLMTNKNMYNAAPTKAQPKQINNTCIRNWSENANIRNINNQSNGTDQTPPPQNNNLHNLIEQKSFRKLLKKILDEGKTMTSNISNTTIDIINDIQKVIKFNIVMLPKPVGRCNFQATLQIDNKTYVAIDVNPKKAKVEAMIAFFTEIDKIDKCFHILLMNRPIAYLILKIRSEFICKKFETLESNKKIEILYTLFNKNIYVGLGSTNQSSKLKFVVLSKIFTNYTVLDDINEMDAMEEQRNIPSLDAVSLLMKLTNSNSIEFQLISTNECRGPFEMQIIIEQLKFKGIAVKKDDAKNAAARSALSALYNISYSEIRFLINNKSSFNSSCELSQTFADYIRGLIIEQLSKTTTHWQTDKQRTVIAGIVMIENSDLDTAKVLNVTTGTRTIDGANLCMNGTVINDTHAEVLSRRCLLDYFYRQLNLLQNFDTANQSIFIKSTNCIDKYQIKENIKFHLFISKSPCGEGSIENSDNRSGKLFGQLRTKMEALEGTQIINPKCNIQTWDGIKKGERLLTMSCSDKVLKWNVVGLQGALLASIIQPVYLTSIIIGSSINGLSMYRAICGRIENDLGPLPISYCLNKPKLNMSISIEKRDSNINSPEYGTIWSCGWLSTECIKYKTGKTRIGTKSSLCKEEMFKKYIKLNKNLRRVHKLEFDYCDSKLISKEYQAAKTELFSTLSRLKLGNWLKKPIEQDTFSQ